MKLTTQPCIFTVDDSKNRHGTEHDVESLTALLEEIGFEVNDDDVYHDYDDASAIKVTQCLKKHLGRKKFYSVFSNNF